MRPEPADRIPASVRLWSLREDVLVEVAPDGDGLLVCSQWGETRLADASAPVLESLQRMSLGPVAVENLPLLRDGEPRLTPDLSGEGPWSRLALVLSQVGNCLVQSLGLEDEPGPVLSVVPLTRQAGFWLPPEVEPDQPVRLSRFAGMRAADGEMTLESPAAQYRVVLHRPIAASVAGSLAAGTCAVEVADGLRLPVSVVVDILSYLVGSGLVLAGEHGRRGFAEDDDLRLLPWSHHDLQFHSRSRMGRCGGPSGAVFPYAGRLPEPPVTRPRPAGPRYPLYRPALPDLAATDPPLTDVLEVSRSYRQYSDRPVEAEEIGELLYRVARIRATESATSASTVEATYTVTDRPYPSTADLYELELYLSLDRCVGLPRGTYHYDPGEHALTLISDSEPALNEVLDIAMVAAGSTRRPPALITMTTRLARLSWMYSGIAYATTLKHVGALQQTLHLVATAMGLASRAVPVSDGELVDEALHLAWPSEVSLGEFLIGVRQ